MRAMNLCKDMLDLVVEMRQILRQLKFLKLQRFFIPGQKDGRTKQNIGFTDKYNYKETEYFLSGNTRVYDLKDDHQSYNRNQEAMHPEAMRLDRKQDYDQSLCCCVCRKILPICDCICRYSECDKVDLPDIWRRSYDYFMRNGYTYVGITSKYCNVEILKNVLMPNGMKTLNGEIRD